MKLADLNFWTLRLPLKISFKHASAERAITESIWVEAQAPDGTVGYGEACPRSYVTGESLDSCREAFQNWRDDILQNCASVRELREWTVKHSAEIDRAPAAWCAIELAVLDLFARQASSTVEELLDVPPISGVFRYSAVLGDQDEQTFAAQLRQYRQWGFSSFKIKLSRERSANLRKCQLLEEAGLARDNCRADANNLWPDERHALGEFAPLAPSFRALEEPLPPGDFYGMRAIAQACGVAIVLDESLLRIEHLLSLRDDPENWILNLRVSKLGGLIRSLQIARAAAEQGIRLIVGAQVGETSLLTRAALTVARAAGTNLEAQEGAFGTHLLAEDVTDPPLIFGARGELAIDDAKPLAIARPSKYLHP